MFKELIKESMNKPKIFVPILDYIRVNHHDNKMELIINIIIDMIRNSKSYDYDSQLANVNRFKPNVLRYICYYMKICKDKGLYLGDHPKWLG